MKMKNKISKFAGLIPSVGGVVVFVLTMIGLAPTTVFGLQQSTPTTLPDGPGPQSPEGIVRFEQISGIFCVIVSWVFTILIVLSVLFILWAAYTYMRSGGDEEKVKEANHQLFYAGIAIIIAIIAKGIPLIIAGFVSNTSITGC